MGRNWSDDDHHQSERISSNNDNNNILINYKRMQYLNTIPITTRESGMIKKNTDAYIKKPSKALYNLWYNFQNSLIIICSITYQKKLSSPQVSSKRLDKGLDQTGNQEIWKIIHNFLFIFHSFTIIVKRTSSLVILTINITFTVVITVFLGLFLVIFKQPQSIFNAI